ncbi:MAG: hypothetical protein ACE5IQ_07785 [Candidatus Methylomirabilales bacterium]
MEIEIVRRSKFSRALHEQRSVESEFRSELQSTTRDEWSSEEESNFKITAEEDFEIFGIGVKSTQEYSNREKTAEEHFREIITKTSSRVSRKYDISIDTKTEVQNQYRSLRKITNPNPCQPVIYNYFQLAKKYKTELILTDIRFDFLAPQLPHPSILRERLNEVTFRAESPYRQNLNLQVVAPPPPWILSAPPPAPTPTVAAQSPILAQFAPLQTFAQPAVGQLATPGVTQLATPVISIAALPPARVPVEPPDVMELTKEELLQKVGGAITDKKILDNFNRELEAFLRDDASRTGLRASYEYCVDTDGLYVEASVSKCSACDEATVELRRLEVETAKVELELKRRGSQ